MTEPSKEEIGLAFASLRRRFSKTIDEWRSLARLHREEPPRPMFPPDRVGTPGETIVCSCGARQFTIPTTSLASTFTTRCEACGEVLTIMNTRPDNNP